MTALQMAIACALRFRGAESAFKIETVHRRCSAVNFLVGEYTYGFRRCSHLWRLRNYGIASVTSNLHNRVMDQTPISDQELRANALLSGLNDTELAKIKDGIQLVQLAEGEHLFTQGQPADRFFMLRRGQIKLYRLSPTGNEKVIEIIRPGQCFAEAVMFMDVQRYPVNSQALVAAELYAINNRNFLGVLRESIDTCFRVLADMSIRLHHRLNEIDALTLQNATLRLVNYLVGQAPKDTENEAEVSLPAAKNIIASRLSVQPETLSRILHSLSDQGLITVKGLSVHIHDVKKLRAYCE